MSGAARRYRRAMRLLWSRALREAHGDRATALFGELHRDATGHGTWAVVALWARSLIGLLSTRWIEWRRRAGRIDSGNAIPGRGLGRDLVGGLRQLAQRPLVSVVVVATLALGIGVNAATFAVFRAVELSGLPVHEPDRLAVVVMDHEERQLSRWQWSYPNIKDLRESSREFESFGVFGGYAANLLGPDGPERVSGARISAGFLATLGIEPVLGREFTREEDRVGGPAVALIAYRLWERQFGRSPDVLGEALTLDGVPYTVIGVLPPARSFLDRILFLAPSGVPPATDVFIPLDPEAYSRLRSTSGYGVVGRLASGASAESADLEARSLLAALQREYANDFCCGWEGRVIPLHEAIVGNTGTALTLAVLAALSVLALVCVNLGSLLTVRAAERGREFAVRRSLGAGPARLVRQVLVEHVLIGVLGAVLGLGLGAALLRMLIALAPATLPRLDEIALDGSTFVATIAAAVIAAVAFGVVPALNAARRDPAEVLRHGQVGLTRRGAGMLRGLVGVEVAMALVVLLASALLVASFRNLSAQDPGYRVDGVVTAQVRLPNGEYPDDAAARALHRQLRESLLGAPRIEAAALASFTYPGGPWTTMTIEGETDAQGNPVGISVPEIAVSTEFFDTLGVPLLAGRDFIEADDENASDVVIVSESMMGMAWPGRTPHDVVGRRLTMGSWRPFMRGAGRTTPVVREVIGVVADVRELGATGRPSLPYIYQPLAQDPWISVNVLLRTGLPQQEAVHVVREAVAAIDPGLPLFGVDTLAAAAARASTRERFLALLVAGFALLAVVLAAVGTYGTVAYSIALRTREIGLRKALGATPAGVSASLLRAGLVAPVIGAGLGMAAFGLLGSSLQALLYEITPLDLRILAPAGLTLLAIAALATWLPARRAGRVDPLVAMQDG